MTSIQCITCKHYRGILTCEAFSDRIPAEIVTGEHDHAEAFEGDGGIRWEKAPDVPGSLVADDLEG